MYDIIIIGGGPAGLTAAVYAKRANKSVLVIEKATFGGQITYSPKVENIPGFLSITGNEFAEKLVDQAISLGADTEFCEVTGIKNGDIKTVVTDSGEFKAKSVIIASGTRHRHLNLANEENFIGNGISFCAVCDGAFYKDKTVAVIGGGNSALQEALLLSDLVFKVYIVQNLDHLTGEADLCKKIADKPNIETLVSKTVCELTGDDSLKGIVIKDAETGEKIPLNVDGIFVAIGLEPQNDKFENVLALDDYGYSDSGEDCKTKTPGIFVAGDCRKKGIRQLTTATSDGAVAALAACKYIDDYKV